MEIVFVEELTAPKGPAELFRKDKTIDACCVITPDMIGLTGGLTSSGTGAEGTVALSDLRIPGIEDDDTAYDALNSALWVNFNTIYAERIG